jgi:hypothetical protein
MYIGFLKFGFRFTASWTLKKIVKVSTLKYSACLNSDYSNRLKIPGVVRVISNPFCIIWCKMWLQIGNHLWFIHVGSPHIFFLQFVNCWTTCFESKQTNWAACSFIWLKSLNSFISVDICSLLFVLQKSVTSRTLKNKHWMDLRRSVRHLEISSETGSHSSEVRHRRWCSRWTIGAFSLVLRRL